MTITVEIQTTRRFEALKLYVEARVRYWEDAKVNGVKDSDGDLIPCREGDAWRPCIDLRTGRIEGWPAGTVADIHYKVCDEGTYWLACSDGSVLDWATAYVPLDLLTREQYPSNDYIVLKVDAEGAIDGWQPPRLAGEDWKLRSRSVAS